MYDNLILCDAPWYQWLAYIVSCKRYSILISGQFFQIWVGILKNWVLKYSMYNLVTQIVWSFVYKNLTQIILLFAYKNVTQSILLFVYKNIPPLRQFNFQIIWGTPTTEVQLTNTVEIIIPTMLAIYEDKLHNY